MSQYTTGEIAKLTGVTVRTVQYYDSRGILIPSDFSEGGRRLYNEEDLRKLRIICFLRELGIQINHINEILEADNAENVISVLLEQQLSEVKHELAEKEQQKANIERLQREMKQYPQFSVEHLGDIANQMKTRKELRRTRATIIGIGLVGNVIEYSALAYSIITGRWWAFGIAMLILVPITGLLIKYYYNNVGYICPECHAVFHPNKKEFFWAAHTPTTRKLTCTCCGYKGFCIETYQPIEDTTEEG